MTKILNDPQLSLEDLADHILYASYDKGIDLFSIEELCAQVQTDVTEMFKKYPQSRVRLKAIGGGGGKGQRILGAELLHGKKADDKAIRRGCCPKHRAWFGKFSTRSRPTASGITKTS